MEKKLVGFKVDEVEKRSLELAAAAKGLSTSEFVREAVRRVLAGDTEVSLPAEEVREETKSGEPKEEAPRTDLEVPAPPLRLENGYALVKVNAIPVPENAGWLRRKWIALRMEFRKARAFLVAHFYVVTGVGE